MEVKLVLIDAGELSKPATALINRISDFVAAVGKPWQVQRLAEAETKAKTKLAETDIQIFEMRQRAAHRLREEDLRHQANIEAITASACGSLSENAHPEQIEDDWLVHFYENARIVSDPQMRQLWSRVLAGEANSSGSFARQTINLIASLEHNDADLFTRLCSFSWGVGNLIPVIFDINHDIYNKYELTFQNLSTLESLGLIKLSGATDFETEQKSPTLIINYFERQIEFGLSPIPNAKLPIGIVILTRAGRQLAPICGAEPVEGFFEFCCDRWREASIPIRELKPLPDGWEKIVANAQIKRPRAP